MHTLWLAALMLVGASQTIHIYQAQNRPASELIAIAESAMGSDGFVTLDARTASLILNGSAASIDRAVRLLERMDRPLRQVVVTQETREVVETDAFHARVSWKATLGPVRIGTLPGPGPGARVAVGIGARRENASASARSMLRMNEGGTGSIATGRALPVLFEPYWGTTTFATVETGFEVTAHVQGGEARPVIQLELRPFAGRVSEGGELNYIAAATAVSIEPGETVVFGEISREGESRETDLTGVETSVMRSEQVLLVKVDLER